MENITDPTLEPDQSNAPSLASHSVVPNCRIVPIVNSRPRAAALLAQAVRVACRLAERIQSREGDTIPHFELLPFKLAASHVRALLRASAGRPKAASGLLRYPGQRWLR